MILQHVTENLLQSASHNFLTVIVYNSKGSLKMLRLIRRDAADVQHAY
jgi:hypothetical protein